MELKHIKELMTAMGRTGTKRLIIKKEGFELELERQENGATRLSESMFDHSDETLVRQENAFIRAASLSSGREIPAVSGASSASRSPDDATGIYVTSPMVGTFYSSPSPDAATFVKSGDKIEKHTVVCVIEAMKVMNEVKAGVSGTITEILVENGHPVEFGTKLFKII
ncbi:MAG: acetyl-CoA carboxylase biotin carboxyl carrier protein [Parachlamydiaceae bacterium]|nr:acetyl-CoA carboxylase biotin carboxyl carrier protein [Parachlamydiaceae bacterium]